MATVSILGVSGYTGMELLRLVSAHPELELKSVYGQRQAGQRLADIYPQSLGHGCEDLVIQAFDPETCDLDDSDIWFFALPHGHTQAYMDKIRDGKSATIIDLSADFRFSKVETYEAAYQSHGSPKTLRDAVYGLPELYEDELRLATFCANPGCYVLSSVLGLLPLTEQGIQGSVIIDAKSGATGAGKKASDHLLFCEVNENILAYGTGTHRHAPEIQSVLGVDQILFSPHLLPQNRGILSTIYLKNEWEYSDEQLQDLYQSRYAKHPFTHIVDGAADTRQVVDTPYCKIKVQAIGDQIVIMSMIDNLLRGASSQAIENMNIMMGWDREAGLSWWPRYA